MSIKTGCLIILFNGLLYSQGFFINGGDVRKFFKFIPTFYDNSKREASVPKGYREQGQHKKYEDNINEKLYMYTRDSREEPENILDYEDSRMNENHGRHADNDNDKNLQKHHRHSKIGNLRELYKRIRSGEIRLIKVKNVQFDQNKFLSLDSVPNNGNTELNSDSIFENNEYISQPNSFRDIAENGDIFGGESDYVTY